MTCRPVIFDMDGVLADSEGISCEVAAAVLREHGARLSAMDVRDGFVGMSTAYLIETVAAEQALRFPPDLRLQIRERSLLAFQDRLRAVAGMPELLAALRAECCVASSSSPERIAATLELVGLYDRLAPHLYSASMVENGKPAPDLFLHAAREMGWRAAECVVVEDSKAGVQAGVAAGMTVIGLTAGEHVEHDSHAPALLAIGADFVAHDAVSLAGRLRELGVAMSSTGEC